MNKNLSNQIKKTNEYRDSLAGEIKEIRKKGKIQEVERMQLFKTLSEEEINAIEKKRINKVSEESRKIREEKKTGKEYIENEQKYMEYKEIAKKLSVIMKISRQEARDVVKNLDTIIEGNKGFMEKFMQSITNLVKGKTPLAKNIEKTRKEKEALEAKIKQIQGKGEISEADKTNLSKLLGEDELALINQMRGEKTSNELEKFLEKEKNRKEKLETSYQEQQALINSIAELLDISENEVVSVLQHLNIEGEKEGKIADQKKEKTNNPVKQNFLHERIMTGIKKIVSPIKEHRLKIILTLAILGSLGGIVKVVKDQFDKNTKQKEVTSGEKKIITWGEEISVKDFLKEAKIDMDTNTFQTINSPEHINFRYIKDKENVIFYTFSNDREEIIGADPMTFQVINGIYSKDKNYIYFYDYNYSHQKGDHRIKRIEGSHPATCQVLDTVNGYFIKDKNTVYFRGKKVKGADAKTFESVKSKNGEKSPYLFIDKNHVFGREGNILNLDAKTFQVVENHRFYKDKNGVYTPGMHKLKGIDSASFEVLGKDTIKDKNGKYVIIKAQRKDNKEWEVIVTKTA